MNLRELEVFRVVMQTKSMTIAAAQLHTSQPNVSRTIGRLQQETGLTLFVRKGLRLLSTPEADALYREVERAYIGVGEIRAAAETIRTSGAGGLRIAATSALSIGVIPRALRLFREVYPHTHVSVHTTDSVTLTKWTVAGYCDVGFASYVPDPDAIEAQLLHEERAVCVVPAKHRLARKKLIKPSDLDGESFISLTRSFSTRQVIDKVFEPDRRRLEIEAPLGITIGLMVGQGLGVSIFNPVFLRSMTFPGVKVLPFEPALYFEAWSMRAIDRIEPAPAAEFRRMVERVLAEGEAY